jgi:hypothetical protein
VDEKKVIYLNTHYGNVSWSTTNQPVFNLRLVQIMSKCSPLKLQ